MLWNRKMKRFADSHLAFAPPPRRWMQLRIPHDVAANRFRLSPAQLEAAMDERGDYGFGDEYGDQGQWRASLHRSLGLSLPYPTGETQ